MEIEEAQQRPSSSVCRQLFPGASPAELRNEVNSWLREQARFEKYGSSVSLGPMCGTDQYTDELPSKRLNMPVGQLVWSEVRPRRDQERF
jgi:hypothetical protein